VFCSHPTPSPRYEAKHDTPDPKRDEGVKQQDRLDDTVGRGRIRCPKCAWQPRKSDRWGCRCGCEWNTFDTAARCPQCGKQWQHTICLRCHAWSLHVDWYTSGEPGPGASG
jgi:hypothetical protein